MGGGGAVQDSKFRENVAKMFLVGATPATKTAKLKHLYTQGLARLRL